MENTNNNKTIKMSELLDAMAWWKTMDNAFHEYNPLTISIAAWVVNRGMSQTMSRQELKDSIEERWWAITEDRVTKLTHVHIIVD